MGFLGFINKYRKMVLKVERDIYGEKQDYLEIYERNQQLEREINARTNELDLANKRMLTLQHIWDMMNSSTPIESVFEKIVNSIQGDLGYLHCAALRYVQEDNQNFIQLLTQTKGYNQVNYVATKVLIDPDGAFADTIKNKKIVQIKEFSKVLEDLVEGDKIFQVNSAKSIIIIPLCPMDNFFGWLCVLNSREELADSENDFLNLFAQQIEISITIASLFQTLKEQAITDPLTTLFNRRYFEESLKKEVTRAKRLNQPFSIIGIDLDYLKSINDKFGHSYGDYAIKTVADVLKTNARSIDLPARMGGEEFNLLLPGIDSNGAMIAAERIRKTIESKQLDCIGHVTASIGVATYFEHSNNVEELLELTDQAMYASKRSGRNKVTLAKPISETSWQEIAVNTFIDILSKLPIERELTEQLKERLQNNELSKDALFSVADALTSTYNPMHADGVMKSKVLLATNLAKRMDLSKNDLDNLRVAILLYDIGNLMLPAEILQKSTPLTDEEMKHIKSHPMIAAQEILKPISYVQDVLPIIEHHHENWDGSGYPKKLSHEQIPLTSQIVLIVDAYFALIENRPYRTKLSQKDAIEIIRQDAGKKWDENLVKEFVTLVDMVQ